jgi:hypothetical protein
MIQVTSEGESNINVESGLIKVEHSKQGATGHGDNPVADTEEPAPDTSSISEITKELGGANKVLETEGKPTCFSCCFGAKKPPKPVPALGAEENLADAPPAGDTRRTELFCGYLNSAASERTASAVAAAADASERLCSGWMASFDAHSRRGLRPPRPPEPPNGQIVDAIHAWLETAFTAEPTKDERSPPPPDPTATTSRRVGCFGWFHRGVRADKEERSTGTIAAGQAVIGIERDVVVVRGRNGQVPRRCLTPMRTR